MAFIRLMLVDDHEIVRAGLRMMLETESDLEIVAEAKSGEEALIKAGVHHPDVIVMDVSLPGMGGVEATRAIRDRFPEVPILALTIHENERYFFQMLDAGALGYLPKRAAPTDLVHAIHTVHDGHVYLYPSLATALVNDYLQRVETEDEEQQSYDMLTPRQREVLTLIAEGMTNTEIGERLGISSKTVARHRENIMGRLDLHSRTELVKYAIRKGLTEV
jgi:DNA-binding NarL/FixJ family response regulator